MAEVGRLILTKPLIELLQDVEGVVTIFVLFTSIVSLGKFGVDCG